METLTENQNEQQKATRAFSFQFHSFASALDLWKVVDIKSNEKQKEG